nr:MAG TPA: hypothetical protein [Caudoviricetes sp.]
MWDSTSRVRYSVRSAPTTNDRGCTDAKTERS